MATLPAIQMKCVAMWEGLALIQRASATLGFLLSGCTAASQANRKRQEKKNTERTEQRWWCGSADSSQTSLLLTSLQVDKEQRHSCLAPLCCTCTTTSAVSVLAAGTNGCHSLTFRPQCHTKPRSWPHLYLAGDLWLSTFCTCVSHPSL